MERDRHAASCLAGRPQGSDAAFLERALAAHPCQHPRNGFEGPVGREDDVGHPAVGVPARARVDRPPLDVGHGDLLADEFIYLKETGAAATAVSAFRGHEEDFERAYDQAVKLARSDEEKALLEERAE